MLHSLLCVDMLETEYDVHPYLQMAGIVCLGVEGVNVTAGAKASQCLTLDTHCRLHKVELIRVAHLFDILWIQVAELDGESSHQAKLVAKGTRQMCCHTHTPGNNFLSELLSCAKHM